MQLVLIKMDFFRNLPNNNIFGPFRKGTRWQERWQTSQEDTSHWHRPVSHLEVPAEAWQTQFATCVQSKSLGPNLSSNPRSTSPSTPLFVSEPRRFCSNARQWWFATEEPGPGEGVRDQNQISVFSVALQCWSFANLPLVQRPPPVRDNVFGSDIGWVRILWLCGLLFIFIYIYYYYSFFLHFFAFAPSKGAYFFAKNKMLKMKLKKGEWHSKKGYKLNKIAKITESLPARQRQNSNSC